MEGSGVPNPDLQPSQSAEHASLSKDPGAVVPSEHSESEDSFDWTGNDARDEEGEDDSVLDFQALQTSDTPQDDGSLFSVRAKILLHHFLLFLLALATVCLVLGLFFTMPKFYSVSLNLWILMLVILVYFPLWIGNGLKKLASNLRSEAKYSKANYFSKLEACRFSLAFICASIIAGIFWMICFPKDCIPPGLFSEFELWEVEETCILNYIPRLLAFCLFAGVLNALNALMMVSLKSSFQEKSYKEKLVDNQFKIYIVERLARATKVSRDFGKLRAASPDAVSLAKERELLYELPFLLFETILGWIRNTRSSFTYQHMQHDAASGAGSQALDEYLNFRRELLASIQRIGYESVATGHPKTDLEAKELARDIFRKLRSSGSKELAPGDFSTTFTQDAICKDAFQVFDLDTSGTITRAEFRGSVVKIFRDQRNLSRSVASTGSVLSVLDTVCNGAVSIGLFLFLLALMGVHIQSILAVTASIILGLNFIVFDVANKTFHSLIFIFVLHPFDVGDQIVVGADLGYSDESVLTVTRINVQSTIFKRWNGMCTTIPNHVLSSALLTNLSRTDEQWERLEFTTSTPSEGKISLAQETQNLAVLRRQIEAFLREHPEDYYANFELKAVLAADSGKAHGCVDLLKFSLKVQCRTVIDNQKRWVRHARILCFVKQAIKELGLDASSPS